MDILIFILGSFNPWPNKSMSQLANAKIKPFETGPLRLGQVRLLLKPLDSPLVIFLISPRFKSVKNKRGYVLHAKCRMIWNSTIDNAMPMVDPTILIILMVSANTAIVSRVV
jgi:hypothetical protein